MNESYNPYISIILSLTGLFLWGLAFILSILYNNHVIWGLFLLIQFFIYYISGMYIQRFYSQANKDSLTNISNRRYFTSRISNISKKKFPISLMIVDIDNFKMINDIYGHLAGDEVLKEIADIFRNNIRDNDIVSRWGGEEFTILLQNTYDEYAYEFADQIRRTIEERDFNIGSTAVSITVSIGIIISTLPIESNEFLKLADIALQKAKETKNTVISYNKDC